MFLQYLPSPIDVKSKFETEDGIYVTFTGERTRDDYMLKHVAVFSEDQGYNKYYYELRQRLAGTPGPIDSSFDLRDYKGIK